MMPYAFQPWSLIGWNAHWIFGTILIIGIILFVAWSLKQREDTLKTWMIWTVVIGLLGVLLTSQFSSMGWGGVGGWNPMMMNGMMGRGMMGNGMTGGGFNGMMDQKTIDKMMGTNTINGQDNTTPAQ